MRHFQLAALLGLSFTLTSAAHAQQPIGVEYTVTFEGGCEYIAVDQVDDQGNVVTNYLRFDPPTLTKSSDTLDDLFAAQVQTPGAGVALTAGYPVDLKRWESGWGAEHDPPSLDEPFGRLLSALALLSLDPAPGYHGFVELADDFVKETSYGIMPVCNAATQAGFTTGPFPFRVELLMAGLNSSVFGRAATLVHEASHAHFTVFGDWHTHNGPNAQCPTGTFTPGECCRGTSSSCDMRFDDWRPSSYHATYLASLARSEFLKGSAAVFQNSPAAANLDRVVGAANDILEKRFAIDPGFRYVVSSLNPDFGLIAPQGNEYTAIQTVLSTPPIAQVVAEPTPMDPVATHFCFLTEVEGQFQRRSQFISIRPDSTGDRWELATGQRADALVPPAILGWNQLIRSSARCLPLNGTNLRTYEVALPIGETEDTVDLEPSDDSACFLMGVRGAMQDSVHGARLIDDGTNWHAHLLSGHTSDETRLSAEFGCVDAQVLSDATRNTPGTTDLACSSFDDGTATPPPPDVAHCALSGVTGQFEGYQEFAEIVPHGPVSTTDLTTWGLSIGENRAFHTVNGYATCFLPPGHPLSSSEADAIRLCAISVQTGVPFPGGGGLNCCE
jgi:hypothetical protein